MIAIVWFRQDLRLGDNEALTHAVKECDEILPVYIDDVKSLSEGGLGEASRVWLHHSLANLDEALQEKGSKLILRRGESLQCLEELIDELSISHQDISVFWNRCYEPATRERDEQIKIELAKNYFVKSFKGNLLFEPWEALKQDGTPYKVFTPYWKNLQKEIVIKSPLRLVKSIKAPQQLPKSLLLNNLNLLPTKPIPRWDKNIISHWQVGEVAALKKLEKFLNQSVHDYKLARDFPAIEGTSKLSPHLHLGEISPRQIFYYASIHKAENPKDDFGVGHLLREVTWREFAYSLLFHFPQTIDQPLNKKFEDFEWKENYQGHLKKWQTGMTGFPIVDAGMRELWNTGWMHNRVRMIVASFLTKNLLIPWQVGEAWFRDTLVDADLASNTMGWQWVAGCGADAAPYFRIFNPTLQSKKFDSEGNYIRHWVPELSDLNSKQIHGPATEIAKICGYPLPMVDLKATRERALEKYSKIK